MTTTVEQRIADELEVKQWQVRAAVELLDGGATVPFVARYRKEVTGTLDDAQLRTLEERLEYLRELEKRRAAILESVASQGKLDPELEKQILGSETKARLEDIYLPFKPRRRTKAQIAREAGLEPLAEALLADGSLDPRAEATEFVDADRGVADAAAALEGARSILVERFAEHADVIGKLRERMWSKGRLVSRVKPGQEQAGSKFSDYFALVEPFTRLRSHRVLALFRGETEDVLELSFEADEPGPDGTPAVAVPEDVERTIAGPFGIRLGADGPGDRWLRDAVRWAWRTRILMHLGLDLRARLRAMAEEEAIRVFAANLKDLLLAAPAGARTTMGLDPGLRTGVKVAVVDATGKVLATDTIYPHEPRRKWDESIATLERLSRAHGVELIAIGNGTASRETDKLAADLISRHSDLKLTKVVVSEAGASVYSASAYASAELPDLDVSIRGAVSIARRLQDPLAELVKIEPRSIGVGQYQHDLPESALARALDGVVEDAVNAVGVDVNTASAPLLRRVSGISTTLATNIVAHRDEHGPFAGRSGLKAVPLLGAKAFEQAAGFLRIAGAADPLDASGVHPESYPVVKRIVRATETKDVTGLIGNTALLTRLSPADFVDEKVGLPTVQDILAELDKPGRDPRPEFVAVRFADGVEKISDLKPGMILEGAVTNVAAFGAFVDVGVHQDGLVHVSAMARTFVKDPREVVKPGDVVKVKVMEVDEPRKRIGLTLRLDDELPRDRSTHDGPLPNRPRNHQRGNDQRGPRPDRGGRPNRDQPNRNQPNRDQGKPRRDQGRSAPAPDTALADALKRAGWTDGPR